MVIFTFIIMFLIFLTSVLGGLILILNFYSMEEQESKNSAFECGFQPFSSAGAPFSMPFFIISLLFLLFDVEIILLSFPSFFPILFSYTLWVTVFLILWATCYEWMSGIFSWLSSFTY